jgi:hypothetical protein
MTTDHELLSGVIAHLRKNARDYANDRAFIESAQCDEWADRLQSLLGEDNPKTVKAWRNMYVSAKQDLYQRDGNNYEMARRLAEESANRFEDAWEKTLKPTGEL